jgi:hypothetical protein
MHRQQKKRVNCLIEALEPRQFLSSGSIYHASAGGTPSGSNAWSAQWYKRGYPNNTWQPVSWTDVQGNMDYYTQARLVVTNLPAHTEIAVGQTEIKLSDDEAYVDEDNPATQDPGTMTVEALGGASGGSQTMYGIHSGQNGYLDYNFSASHVGNTVTVDFSTSLSHGGYWSIMSVGLDWNQAQLSMTADGTPIEGQSEGFFGIHRTGDNLSGGLPFAVTKLGGDAVEGTDYTVASSYSFVAGQVLNNVQINPMTLDDQQPEWTKYLTMALTPGMGYAVTGAVCATLPIKDDDTSLHLTLGAHVPIGSPPVIAANTNDTNSDGNPDLTEGAKAGNTLGDPELIPLVLTAPQLAKPGATVSLQVSGGAPSGPNYRLWADPYKHVELANTTWTGQAAPHIIYVEGIAASRAVGDVTFTLSATDAGLNPTVFQPATLSMTIVSATINAPEHQPTYSSVEDQLYRRLIGTLNHPTLEIKGPPALVSSTPVTWDVDPDADPFVDFQADATSGHMIPLTGQETDASLRSLPDSGTANTFTIDLKFFFAHAQKVGDLPAKIGANLTVGGLNLSPHYYIRTVSPTFSSNFTGFSNNISVAQDPFYAPDPNHQWAGYDMSTATGVPDSIQVNIASPSTWNFGMVTRERIDTPTEFAPAGPNYNGGAYVNGRTMYIQTINGKARSSHNDTYYTATYGHPDSNGLLPDVLDGGVVPVSGYNVFPWTSTQASLHDSSGTNGPVTAWEMGVTHSMHDSPGFTVEMPKPGLVETQLGGSYNTAGFTPSNTIKPGPMTAQNVPPANFPPNITMAYTGWVYVPDNGTPNDGQGKIAFGVNWADGFILKIDGQMRAQQDWGDDTRTCLFSSHSGYHKFELRLGFGGWGQGPNVNNLDGWGGNNPVALGVNVINPTLNDTDRTHYVFPDNNVSMANVDGTANNLFLTGGDLAGKRKDKFTTTLMYTPGGVGDSWVPIKQAKWHWSGHFEADWSLNKTPSYEWRMVEGFPRNPSTPYTGDGPVLRSDIGDYVPFPDWAGSTSISGIVPNVDTDQSTTIWDTPIPMD